MVKDVLRIMILTVAIGTIAHAMEDEQKPNAFAVQMAALRLEQQARYEEHLRAEAEEEEAAVAQAWHEAVTQGDLERMKAHAAKVIEHQIACQAEVDGLIALLERRDISSQPEHVRELAFRWEYHATLLGRLQLAGGQQRSKILLQALQQAKFQLCPFIAQAIEQHTFVSDDLMFHNDVAGNLRRLLHIPSIACIIGPELDALYIFYRYGLWRLGRPIADIGTNEVMHWLEELILHHDKNNDTRAIINLYRDYLRTSTLAVGALDIIYNRLVVPCIRRNRQNILINILEGNIFDSERQQAIAQAAAVRQERRDEGALDHFVPPMPVDPSVPLLPPVDQQPPANAELREIYQQAHETQNLEMLEGMRDQFVAAGVLNEREIDDEIALLKGILASLAAVDEQEAFSAASTAIVTASTGQDDEFEELAPLHPPVDVAAALMEEYGQNNENLAWLEANRDQLIEAGIVTRPQVDEQIELLRVMQLSAEDAVHCFEAYPYNVGLGQESEEDEGELDSAFEAAGEEDEYPDEILDDPGEPGIFSTIWRTFGSGWGNL